GADQHGRQRRPPAGQGDDAAVPLGGRLVHAGHLAHARYAARAHPPSSGRGPPQKAPIDAEPSEPGLPQARHQRDPNVTREPPSCLLAAGGTGGHLFPAFALAAELGRRGQAVDLATDMRGDRYGTGFPARTVYRLPSATPGSKKNPIALARAGVTLLRG